jgi:hypothetical protein
MKMLFPDASLRSPTAVQGTSDVRDENVYSSAVATNGATGNITVFTVPRGQRTPVLGSGAPAPHQITQNELHTNISQSGQLGSAIGDCSIRALGINVENAWYAADTGLPNTYGAGQQELSELLSKTFFQLRIGGKLQIQGPTLFFPSSGGIFGGISTSQTTVTVASQSNGYPGSLRRLKTPILVARTDTLEGTFGVTGGGTLIFSGGAQNPQPCLVWFNIHALVKGDAR